MTGNYMKIGARMYSLEVQKARNEAAFLDWQRKNLTGLELLEEISHMLQFGDISPAIRVLLERAAENLRAKGVKEDLC